MSKELVRTTPGRTAPLTTVKVVAGAQAFAHIATNGAAVNQFTYYDSSDMSAKSRFRQALFQW